MTTGAAKPIQIVFRYSLYSFLCIAVLAVFIPWKPAMPAFGLDPSWMMAMNQAAAQGYIFGKDIVFTFGPYASIYTELYHPSTNSLMISGSLFLGVNYALLLLLLARDQKIFALLLYVVFLSGFVDSRDALLFSYPLMMAIAVYRMTLPNSDDLQLHFTGALKYSSLLLFAPFGLLPLIKGSLLPFCAVTVALCFAIFWIREERSLAGLAAVIPAISCALFWNFSGQRISELPGFFWNMRQIISGYTDAMAFPGNPRESALFILATGLILVVIARSLRGPINSKLFLCLSYGLFLFIAFKAGFVRQDPWHNIIAGTSILAAALLLLFILEGKQAFPALAAAALVWIYIGHGAAMPSSTEDIFANFKTTYGQAFQGARARASGKDDLRAQYDQHIAAIRVAYPIPQLPGSMDIYSFNQSWVLASGNSWAPRPVTQSYSAYTPELAAMNLHHLQGANAPENILFRVEPIDGRLPSLEDGPSWPSLINNYSLQKLEGDTAYLRKRATISNIANDQRQDFFSARHSFGEEVQLSDSATPQLARMEITPTLLGKLRGALYKLPELHIAMRLRSGKIINYRMISNMARSDFLITPLVTNTEDFAFLGAGGDKYLTGNEVMSLKITSDDAGDLLWSKDYRLTLRKLEIAETSEADSASLFDKIEAAEPASLSPPATQVCEGMIEAVNGTPPRSGIPAIRNALSVRGWMAESGVDGTVPDFIFVTLASESGKTIFVKARRTPRNDIRAHFHQPDMPDPGYSAMIDVSSLSGPYMLGLARSYKGNLQFCRQFQFPIQIVH